MTVKYLLLAGAVLVAAQGALTPASAACAGHCRDVHAVGHAHSKALLRGRHRGGRHIHRLIHCAVDGLDGNPCAGGRSGPPEAPSFVPTR
jgi:hypothetical protein